MLCSGGFYSGTPVLAQEFTFPQPGCYAARLRKFDCGDFRFRMPNLYMVDETSYR